MKAVLKILGVATAVMCLVAGGIVWYLSATDPEAVAPDATLEGVAVQPQQALALAKPHLAEHGTYAWRADRPLQTTIVRGGSWYFVKATNYPAKSLRYYLHGAVKVHVQTGEVAYSAKVGRATD